MIRPVARRLPDGRRLHLQHGPMDLIVQVDGPRESVERAEAAATARFGTILAELAPQLDALRSPVTAAAPAAVRGTVAERMNEAALRFADVWVTPMVAVAGSVAEEVCGVIAGVDGVTKAYVNNGGDVALHLVPGSSLRVGLVSDLTTGRADRVLTIDGYDDIRGMATSGAGGRSHSLGIADAVTAIGTRTSVCDAAATLVANGVDLPGDPRIQRMPACSIEPDSDLGDKLVTVEVPDLCVEDVDAALEAGAELARRHLARTAELRGFVLHLQGRHRVVGDALDRLLAPTKEPAHAR